MRTDEHDRFPGDGELVRRACESPDEATRREAAAELLGRYRARVYAWCMRHLGDHDRALDMAQEILLLAYRNLGSYQGRSPFAGWLWAVTRNRCLNELRRPRLLSDEEVELDALPSPGRRPDEALEESLHEAQLVALIHETLDPVEQQALRLRCFERMPVDAVTRALGIQEASGARAVLQRARRKLRAALADRERAREEDER
jgi:RNA polymerase sigma-70 factor (ECF subfamily)